jgi:hypothetical protein
LRAVPTGHHFDPLRVHLNIFTPTQGVVRSNFVHPWPAGEDYQVCAGPGELVDHKGKHLEVLTFGGALHIQPEEDHTLLNLTSPAPILLPAASPLDQLLVEEVEIVLAQRQAARESEPGLYEEHLETAPPLALYHAMLTAIQERYRHLPPNENVLILKFRYTLQEELNAVEAQLSAPHHPSVEGLL